MGKINLEELNSMQYDVLRELGNIGAGNATTALSEMINRRIDIGIPRVRLLDLTEIPTIVGNEDDVMVGILIMLSGDINGMMICLMDRNVTRNLVNVLLNTDKEDLEFDDFELSAVSEIGNIVTGAYMRSLSEMTGLTIDVSVPKLSIDMVGAILSVPAIEFGQMGDKVLLIETEFDDEEKKRECVTGYHILVPDEDSYDRILKSLGV